MGGALLGNIMAPTMVFWQGWWMAAWVAGGIAVELVLIKFIFRLGWWRAVRLGLLMNLASTLVGVPLLLPGIVFIVAEYYEPFFWVLQLGVAALASAYIQRLVADFFMEPIQDPFMFRWLMLINVVGIGIAKCSMWVMPLFD